jgi:hypothetical protein
MFVLKTIIDEYCVADNTKLYSCFIDFQKAYDTVIHTVSSANIRQFTGLSFINTASPEECKYFGRSLIKILK